MRSMLRARRKRSRARRRASQRSRRFLTRLPIYGDMAMRFKIVVNARISCAMNRQMHANAENDIMSPKIEEFT